MRNDGYETRSIEICATYRTPTLCSLLLVLLAKVYTLHSCSSHCQHSTVISVKSLTPHASFRVSVTIFPTEL